MMIKMKMRVQKSSIYETANNDEDNENDKIGRKKVAHSHELPVTNSDSLYKLVIFNEVRNRP